MANETSTDGSAARTAILRAAGYFVLWLALTLGSRADLAAGLVAAAAAAWTSLKLLPPGKARLDLLALAVFVLRFLRQSVVAGIDVARRAFDPACPLRPGYVVYSTALAPGTARSAFTTLASLLPGTMPADTTADGQFIIHCLDVSQPVAADLAHDEALFQHILHKGPAR